ncbi:MAG: DUF2382 domain-containing protein [Leptolyngbya sp. SIO4C1]|nr:DUF2382 domain-containing protein [Leptolyngbya sp. SIO4C1]
MALYSIADRYPDYQQRFFEGSELKGAKVYVSRTADRLGERFGTVQDILVDEAGQVRCLVVKTGFWRFGKQVMLPIDCCSSDLAQRQVYVTGLTSEQLEQLPRYAQLSAVDAPRAVDGAAPVELSTAVEAATVKDVVIEPGAAASAAPPAPPAEAAEAADEQPLALYEERLVVDKRREKTGEIKITQRVETTQTGATDSGETEKIIIEIESPPGTTQVNLADESLALGKAAQLELHAEQAVVHKQAVPREAVSIRKEAEHETVTAREPLQKETLTVRAGPTTGCAATRRSTKRRSARCTSGRRTGRSWPDTC